MEVHLLVLLAKSAGLQSSERRVRVCERQIGTIGIPIASKLLSPIHYEALCSICLSVCMRYEGNWMAQILRTLGHMLSNWLLIMHGWLRRHARCPDKKKCLFSMPLLGSVPFEKEIRRTVC